MARQGITSYLDAAVGATELAALATLCDRGPLTIRPSVAIQVSARSAAEPDAMLARLERLRVKYARPGVTLRTVKMFFDGVIEHPTQTAALLRPYRVNKGTKRDPRWVAGKSRGPTYFRQDVADGAIAALDAAGWQVHIHAIGDRAVRSGLDAFEHARRRGKSGDNRHTITHLELVDPDDFGRFEALGVLASMQLHWAERDSYTVDRSSRTSARGAGATPIPPAASPAPGPPVRGERLAGGSAAAVPPDRAGGQPHRRRGLRGLRQAAVRQGGSDTAGITAMHTRNSAYQLHQENLSGRIRRASPPT